MRPLLAEMDGTMTLRAERNQILLCICSCLATKLLMVDFQVEHRAARLTAPIIPA